MKMNNRKNNRYIGWLCCAALGFFLSSCNTPQRLEAGQREDILRFRSSDCGGGVPQGYFPVVLQDSVRGGELVISRDWNTGEHVKTIDVGRVHITSRTNIVSDRNGKASIAFVIRVPEPLTEQDWRIEVTPTLDAGGRATRLKPVVVRGHVNDNYYRRKDAADKRKLLRDVWLRKQLQERTDFFRDSVALAGETAQAEERFTAWADGKRLRLEGLKHDEVTGHTLYEYVYCQELDLTGISDEMDVYFHACLENMGQRRFRMETRDTLHYYISSLADFRNEDLRWRSVPVDTVFHEKYYFQLYFRQGKSALDRRQAENARSLDRMQRMLESNVQLGFARMDRVDIVATCSPEGSTAVNNRLGAARARSVKGHLQRIFPDYCFTTSHECENWDGLAKAIRRMDWPQTGTAEAMLSLIDSIPDLDRREAELRRRFPAEYRRLYAEVYPSLREVVVDLQFVRDETVLSDTRRTLNAEYARALEFMAARRYADALDILEPYRDWNTAVCLLCMGRDREAAVLLATFPEQADRFYLQAVAHERLGEADKAVRCLQRAFGLDPQLRLRINHDPETERLIREFNL